MDLSLGRGSGFAQQGQIDWVALSNNTVSATIAVFARLAAAKLDVQTVAIGHALSGSFKLSIAGQRRIQSALANLKWRSSMNDVLWFGFGVQHPIRHLERTENGYSCIALCGALSTISEDLEAAAVLLTEFADINGAPRHLRPSLHQWHGLVKACAGSLMSTKFECIANQYMLLSGTLGEVSQSNIGEPRDVALALNAIGRLSRGEIAAITLAGGAICGWLAAFAHFFMDLEIELQDSNKSLLTKTVAENKRVHIIVLFGETPSPIVQLSSTSYHIRDGLSFFKPSYWLQTGRVPWDEAIQRSFGSLGTRLLKAKSFGTLIGSAARIFAAIAHSDKDIPKLLEPDLEKRPPSRGMGVSNFFINWTGYNVESFGRGYVNFALDRLPELKCLRDTVEPCLGYSVRTALAEYKAAALKLEHICHCKFCLCQGCRRRNPMSERSPNCIYRFGEFIIILLWQLSVVNVSTMIQPTQRGLQILYDAWYDLSRDSVTSTKGNQVGSITPLLCHLNAHTAYQSLNYIFAGHDDNPLITRITEDDFSEETKLFPAKASQGLSFFVDTLVEISDRPETRKFLHILPGTIVGPSGTYFDRIEDGDLAQQYQKEELKPLQDYTILEEGSKTRLESRLLAQESLQHILVGIQFSGPKGNIYIGPMRLQQAILQSVGLIQCSGRGCDLITQQESSKNRIMVMEDGLLARKSIGSSGRTVILRKVAGNLLARCVGLAVSMRDHSEPFGPFPSDSKTILLRRDECIPCCIRAGLASDTELTHIIL